MRLACFVPVALLLVPALASGRASAQESGGFGVGFLVGEPTGVTARFMHGGNNFQVHAAWSFTHDAGVQLNGDYLRSGQLDTDPMMPFYFGLGARIKFSEDTQIGARIPLGMNHFFKGQPIEVFGEVVPVVNLLPETEFKLNGAVGARYYLR